MGPEAYITANDISVSFNLPGGVPALEAFANVSFSVSRGTIVSIIGPSGCGKTTLLNCIGGLLTPRRGSLTIDGKTPREARKARYFGLVPQDASLFEWKTVFENVSLPLEIFGHQSESVRKRTVQSFINLVGLAGFENLLPRALSGGMRQRASLARALSFGPPVLLMDEPFGALDAQTRELMNFEVLRLWSAVQSTVVVITHDVTEAVLLSDRVLVMTRRPGRIGAVFDITLRRPRSREILDSEELHTYTRQIREILFSQDTTLPP